MAAEVGEEGILDALDGVVPYSRMISRFAPTIWKQLETRLTGKDLALFGHPEAGKTSLLKFLQTGKPTNPNKRMDRTTERYFKRSVGLKLSGDREAAIVVRKIIDRPGQAQGRLHGIEFCREKPHHSIIMLDATLPYTGRSNLSISGYLDSFWEEVRLNGKFRGHRVERVWVWINKFDQVAKGNRAGLIKKVDRELARLSAGLVSSGKVHVRASSLIDDPEWNACRENLVAEIIADMVNPA